jgi:AcrR family transcriptional regulator
MTPQWGAVVANRSFVGVRGPYAKSSAVRRRIVDAAQEVFAERGYWATTMKEIALRAGISQRGLVHHFAAKEDLLTAVIDLRDDDSAKLMAPLGRPVDAFTSMLVVVAENMNRPGLVALYTVLTAEAASPGHPAHERYRERYSLLRTYFSMAFDALREQGELQSPLPSNSLAAEFIALIDGLQLQWLYDPTNVDVEQVLRAFLTSIIPHIDDLPADFQ